jgi:hypothetical protein
LDIKKRGDSAGIHPDAIFFHSVIKTDVLANSLVGIGQWVADHGINGDGAFQAARDLLLRLPPRIGGRQIQRSDESSLEAALRAASRFDGGLFPIQGPPGSGKTHAGARMVCELVKSGKTVGITANSHRVIRNFRDLYICLTQSHRPPVDVSYRFPPLDVSNAGSATRLSAPKKFCDETTFLPNCCSIDFRAEPAITPPSLAAPAFW